jgi:hypothetical protein
LNNIHEVNVEVTEIDNFIIMKNGKWNKLNIISFIFI